MTQCTEFLERHLDRRQALRLAILLALVVALLVVFLPRVDAHPGGTDGNGCHTCRTNCTESWGIPYGYYHRHSPVRPCFPPPTTTTTTVPPTTTTMRATTTTRALTTTRAPPSDEVDRDHATAMLTVLDPYSDQVSRLEEEAIVVNGLWNDRDIGFGETDRRLKEIWLALSDLDAGLADEIFGNSVERDHVDAQAALKAMVDAAAAMIDGLHAPDTGEARTEALADLVDAAARFQAIRNRVSEIAHAPIPTKTMPPTTSTAVLAPTVTTTSPVASSPGRADSGQAPWSAVWMIGVASFALGWMLRRRRSSD